VTEPGTVTWLHLSDLHLCKPKNGVDRYRVLRALRDDLAALRDKEGLTPDFLFITGDLAYGQLSGKGSGWALPDQYAEVHEFIEQTRGVYNGAIPRERVFFVPGNHDVDRSRVTPALTNWLDTRTGLEDVDRLLADADLPWQQYADRLHAYDDFIGRYGYSHLFDDRARMIYGRIVNLDGAVSVGIAGLNSAWSCSRPREWGQVWAGGRRQIDHLLPSLEGAVITIGLMHHPCRSLAQSEATRLDHDISNQFDFFLHGHEHLMFLDATVVGHHRIAAGATYQGSQEENAYNIVRLNLAEGRGEVWMRKYDSLGDGWIPRVVAHFTDDRGIWKLSHSLAEVSQKFHKAKAAAAPSRVEAPAAAPLNVQTTTVRANGTASPPATSTAMRQAAAVCVRNRGDRFELLLMKTSQERWLFPKKRINRAEVPSATALRAAESEGGIKKATVEPLLEIDYHRDEDPVVGMASFLLDVEVEDRASAGRQTMWCPVDTAMTLLMEKRPLTHYWPLLTVVREAWLRYGAS
jgi:predicted MPP superfamily phosphohydrolase